MNENTFTPVGIAFFSCSESGPWKELVLLCRMSDLSTTGLIFALHREVLPRSLKLLPTLGFSPK